MSPQESRTLWRCDDAIARLNVERLGQMVRWLAENQIKSPEDLRAFDQLGYQFHHSTLEGNRTVLVWVQAPGD